MAHLKSSSPTHQRLARLRRRSWAAIGLCMIVRVGDAALHASQPDGDQNARISITRTCLPDPGGLPAHL